MKTSITVLLLCVFGISFGQDFKNDLTSVKTVDDQIQEEKYSSDEVVVADRLVLKTPVDRISKRDKQFYSKKEWRKIKKQLLKNKKRISKLKDGIHTSKTIDTVYINIQSYSSRSSLFGHGR